MTGEQNENDNALVKHIKELRLCRIVEMFFDLDGYHAEFCLPGHLPGAEDGTCRNTALSLKGDLNISSDIKRIGDDTRAMLRARTSSSGDEQIMPIPQITIGNATIPAFISIIPVTSFIDNTVMQGIHTQMYNLTKVFFGSYRFSLELQLLLMDFDADDDAKGKISIACRFSNLRRPLDGSKGLLELFFLLGVESQFNFVLQFSVEISEESMFSLIVEVKKDIDFGKALAWTDDFFGIKFSKNAFGGDNTFVLFWKFEILSEAFDVGADSKGETKKHNNKGGTNKKGVQGYITIDTVSIAFHLFSTG